MPDQISNISTDKVNYPSETASKMTTGARFVGLLETVVNRSFDSMDKHIPALLASVTIIYCVKHGNYKLAALGFMALMNVSNLGNASDAIKQKFGITNNGDGDKFNGKNIPQKTENGSQTNLGETNNSAKADVVGQVASPATSMS